jgi:predicted P-loop ATPase/GTPase
MSVPTYGIADIKFVITVAPQKLICPHGKTYPMNAVAIITIKITTPMFQTISLGFV